MKSKSPEFYRKDYNDIPIRRQKCIKNDSRLNIIIYNLQKNVLSFQYKMAISTLTPNTFGNLISKFFYTRHKDQSYAFSNLKMERIFSVKVGRWLVVVYLEKVYLLPHKFTYF